MLVPHAPDVVYFISQKSGVFGNSSDFLVGRRLIYGFAHESVNYYYYYYYYFFFFFAQRLKKLTVALNLMGPSGNRKQDFFFFFFTPY